MPNHTYSEYAEEAVRLEQSAEYIDAAFAWKCASLHARNNENRHWAESRSDFCSQWTKERRCKEAA